MNAYDAMMIVPDGLNEEQVEGVLQRVKEEVARADGIVKSCDILGRRSFARPMKKQESGKYVRMLFDLAPAAVEGLNGRFKLIDGLFRVQITRAVPRPVVEESAAPADEDVAVESSDAPAVVGDEAAPVVESTSEA